MFDVGTVKKHKPCAGIVSKDMRDSPRANVGYSKDVETCWCPHYHGKLPVEAIVARNGSSSVMKIQEKAS